MSYVALYRKWRPAVFEDVKGQDHIVTTLKNQINASRLGHAYLFCGTRGTGKTTIAKILAKAVNCENPVNGSPCGHCSICEAISSGSSMNVVEIDAASNNGVDNVRDIKADVSYPPTSGRYKVYIIDEVHMLSTAAFNALLKTLEEPPSYVIFILATTEVNKIPITILSRCQRYDFKRITVDTISGRLMELMGEEGIDVEPEAIRYVAKMADGSMRDALSLLDQCLAFYMGQKLKYENVLEVLGAVDTQVFSDFFRTMLAGDAARIIVRLDGLIEEGRDLTQFVSDFTWYLRNVMLVMASPEAAGMLDMSQENLALLKDDAGMTDLNGIMRYITLLSELTGRLRGTTQKRVMVETTLIRMAVPAMDTDLSAVLDRVKVLERRIAEGVVVQSSQSVTVQDAPKEKPKALKPARSEDIIRICGSWKSICSSLSLYLKPVLQKHTVVANGGGNKLQLIYNNATCYEMVSLEENQALIKSAIAEKTGCDVELEVIFSDSPDVEDEYDTLEDLCKLNIENEDF